MFLTYSLRKFNNDFNKTIYENENNLLNLKKFSYNIYFEPPPSEINITNPYECTPTDLQLCSISDPFSCSGCKSLISKCTNFIKDIKYIDFDGNETIIPANSNSDEGYCLTTRNPSQVCNPYHGDLVLIQTEQDSNESMLICNCKNPGFIGNLEIGGSCSDVFICNGKIDNINKPLEEINCICEDGFTSENKTTPVCVEATVDNFNYTDSFFSSIIKLSKDHFNDDIRNNYKGQYLKNPCNYCLITGEFIPDGYITNTEDGGFQCASNNIKSRGIPIRRSNLERLLKGAEGPDAMINIQAHNIIQWGYISNEKYEDITVIFTYNNNKDILKILNPSDTSGDAKTYYALDMRGHQVVLPGSFGGCNYDKSPLISCNSHGFGGIKFYACEFRHSIPADRTPQHWMTSVTKGNVTVKLETPCPPPWHKWYLNSTFRDWRYFESLNPFLTTNDKYITNNLRKIELNPNVRSAPRLRIVFISYHCKNSTIYGYSTYRQNYIDVYNAGLIPKDPESWDPSF